METSAATRLETGMAFGAAARKSFKDPHSSASMCEKATWRSLSMGRTLATASLTRGNMRRGPAWNKSRSSPAIKHWLKLSVPGPSGVTIRLLTRQMHVAIA